MKVTNIYAVLINADTNEGRGPMLPLAYFHTKQEALAVVSDKRFAKWGVQGHLGDPGSNVSLGPMCLYDSPEDFWKQHDNENKKMHALAKLTDEEKTLLGLR